MEERLVEFTKTDISMMYTVQIPKLNINSSVTKVKTKLKQQGKRSRRSRLHYAIRYDETSRLEHYL